ncbi:chymotrypsin-2-like [Anopheles ziemanni]|uniref:chymotrypsin-2-like n=1 Tax=Anopheles coustani TaxID=139045 RepID=UPI0026585345|nr:chymotrypsin-2-like [Anopheles coustani]XP_058169148.1 chymotrypsin-2-like [Anopheles ziemanni]
MSRSLVAQTAAILALIAVSTALPQLEKPRNPRIAGGAEAQDGQFPFQVALINEGLVYCGGSVVNRRWILTAAACLIGKQLSDVQLFLGSVDRLVGGRNVTAERFILHPDFDQQTYANDIALIRIREVLAFNNADQLQSIELATEFFETATDATVSGWGRFSISNNQLPNRLQFIRTDIIDTDDCAAQFEEPYASRISEQRTICTSNQPDQGVCLGDAGGPLVLDGVLVGVQSWSIPCGLGLPDVYERVSHHRPWILVHTLL